MKASVSIMIFFSTILFAGAQLPWEKEDVCLNEEELKLYELITAHRLENGRKEIPLSFKLTWLAQIHALDLVENHSRFGNCNMHSWSANGPWEECCYTDEDPDHYCMWDKPKEVTNYKGRGYEIVFMFWPAGTGTSLAEKAMQAWKNSPGHNNTILNKGSFSQSKWRAMGVGIMRGYVVVWFGENRDRHDPPIVCEK